MDSPCQSKIMGISKECVYCLNTTSVEIMTQDYVNQSRVGKSNKIPQKFH